MTRVSSVVFYITLVPFVSKQRKAVWLVPELITLLATDMWPFFSSSLSLYVLPKSLSVSHVQSQHHKPVNSAVGSAFKLISSFCDHISKWTAADSFDTKVKGNYVGMDSEGMECDVLKKKKSCKHSRRVRRRRSCICGCTINDRAFYTSTCGLILQCPEI